MAIAITKIPLSGSTNGKPIKITGTNSAGAVTIHTGQSGTAGADEVILAAANSHTASVSLTLAIGGTVDPDNLIVMTLEQRSIAAGRDGLIPIVGAGELVINNSIAVTAWASVANVVTITGCAHRVTN